jgi:hypothetical protein
VKKINDETSLKANLWYLDDSNLVGSPEDLEKAKLIVESDAPLYGLHVNSEKTELWTPDDEVSGIEILGGPVGDVSFSNSLVKKRVDKIRQTLCRLRDLQITGSHPQAALQLLRSCIAIPKMMFALRASHPDKISAAIKDFDDVLNTALNDIIGSAAGLSSHQRLLLALPIRLGGLGIPSAKMVSWSAYSGSLILTGPLQATIIPDGYLKFDSVVEMWCASNHALSVEEIRKLRSSPKPQSFLFNLLAKKCLDDLLNDNNMPPMLKSNIATRNIDSSRWSIMPPSNDFGMSAPVFRAALKLNLGLNVYPSNRKCACGKISTASGSHDIHCKKGGRLFKRHEAIKDVLAEFFKDADVEITKEVTRIFDSSNQRPADIFVPTNILEARKTCLDVTIVSPFKRLDNKNDSHLIQAETDKVRKYENKCNRLNLKFIPFSLDCFGRMGPKATWVVDSLAVLLATYKNFPVAVARSDIVNKLCFTAMKFTAAAIVDRRL